MEVFRNHRRRFVVKEGNLEIIVEKWGWILQLFIEREGIFGICEMLGVHFGICPLED